MNTTQDMLDYVKRALNYNPQFDDAEIIPEVNAMIRELGEDCENLKQVLAIQTTQGRFEYVIEEANIARELNVFYGQQDPNTLTRIEDGYVRLLKMSREQLGKMPMGYWMERVSSPSLAIPYYHAIKLNFDPETNMYLYIEYTTWAEIPFAAFAANEYLQTYIPRELNLLVANGVIWKLKLRDRDETWKVDNALWENRKSNFENTYKERVVYLDD